jgi:Protein of unknown function (DUF6044)
MSRASRALVAHPWIVYVVLVLLAFPITEMLLHGEGALQYAHDVFDDDVPRLFSIPADVRVHGLVLWNPHLTAGNALVAQFALPPLAPDVLLSFVVPPFAAYAANHALMTFAAGISMHLFLRDSLRLTAVACFAGGIMATFAFWHYILGYAALLLPLVLWTTDRLMAPGRRRRDVLAAILVVTFLLLSSQVQIVVIDGGVTLAWVLATTATGRRPVRRVADLAAVWVMAALLAAPVLASQVVAIPESHRAIWDLGYLYPLEEELRDYAALYGGILVGVPVTAGVGGTADIYGSFFLGAIGLVLLVVGVVAPRRTAHERLLLGLLVAIPVIDLVALLAVPLQEHVALLRSFQFVRVRHLMPVVLAMNTAIGVAWLAGPDPIGRLSRSRCVAAVAGLLVVGLAIVVQGWVALRHVQRPSGSDLARDGWQLGLVALAGGAAVAVAIVLILGWRNRRPGAATASVGVTVVAVLLLGLTAERIVYARSERSLGGNLGTWVERVASTTGQRFIAGQPGGGRVISIGEHANRALVAELDAVDGYETIYPLRYHELFRTLIGPQLALDPARAANYDDWGNRVYAFGPNLDMDVADLLGVRWLYVRGDRLTDPDLVAKFTDGDVTVYESPGAFPRAFVAHDLRVLTDRAAVSDAIAATPSDELRSTAFLAADELGASGPPSTAPASSPDEVVVEADAVDRLNIRARSDAPGVLVLADTYSPDWVAEIDGVPTPILPVDIALRGVALPAGDHLVTFSYRPVATYAGLALALIALIAIVGWLALGVRRRHADGPATSESSEVEGETSKARASHEGYVHATQPGDTTTRMARNPRAKVGWECPRCHRLGAGAEI